MLQQPPSYNFDLNRSHTIKPKASLIQKMPSVLIDFTAITLCDLIKTRVNHHRSLPEFVFFVYKITYQASVNVRTLLVALIYLERAKSHLPKRAIGSDDTSHRMFLGAILTATKFLSDTTWVNQRVSNRRIYEICGGLFSLEEIHQLERAFLKLIQYDCWVDDITLNEYVKTHRSDFSI